MGKWLENTLQRRVAKRPTDRWTGAPPPYQGNPYWKHDEMAPSTARVAKTAKLVGLWSSFLKLWWDHERMTISER